MTAKHVVVIGILGLLAFKGCPMLREYQERTAAEERKESLRRMIEASNPLPPGAGPPPAAPASASFDQVAEPPVPAAAAFDPLTPEARAFKAEALRRQQYASQCMTASRNLSNIHMVEGMPDNFELRRQEKGAGTDKTKWVAMTAAERSAAKSETQKFIDENCLPIRNPRP